MEKNYSNSNSLKETLIAISSPTRTTATISFPVFFKSHVHAWALLVDSFKITLNCAFSVGKVATILLFFLLNRNLATGQCTSTVYYDNMETYTWVGGWYNATSFSTYASNQSVSPTTSAVTYGTGNGSSAYEGNWYVLPNITGLNPANTYKVKFRLGSYRITNTGNTSGVDAGDYIVMQLSTDGGLNYVSEIQVKGNNNAYWDYSASGVASKTANGILTTFSPSDGGLRTTDGFSTVELTLPAGSTQCAVDIYCRANAAGEEWWMDNVELIETIPQPSLSITGNTPICLGGSLTLTASGAGSYTWDNGITNGVSFSPASSNTYTVTGTNIGMINGLGTQNSCTSTLNTTTTVKTPPTAPTSIASSLSNTICSGQTTSLSLSGGTDGSGATYQWFAGTCGSTVLGTEATLSVSPTTTTTYFVRRVGTLPCNGTTTTCASLTITVNQPSTSISVNNTSIANGDYLWNGNTSTDGSLASNWYVLNNGVYSLASAAPTSADEVFIIDFLDGGSCISSSNDASTPASGTFNSKHVFIGDGAALSLGANSTLNVTGNFTNDGTFTPGTGTVNFTGTAATQTISGTGALNFSNVTINKSAGEVSLSNDISVSGSLTFNNGNLNLNGKTMTYSGGNISTNSGIIGSTTSSKLKFTASSQIPSNLFQSNIYDFEISGVNTSVTADAEFTITNDLIVGSQATLTFNDGRTITMKGNITNNGTINGLALSELIFDKDGNQSVSGSALSVGTLTLNKLSGILTLNAPLQVKSTLTMTKGDIVTSSVNILEVGSDASNVGSVSWTAGTVRGPMKRWFAAATNSNQATGIFPVGATIPGKGVINRYAQVNFTSTPGTGGYIIAEYKTGTPSTGYTGLPLTYNTNQYIQNFEEEGYWDITPYNSSNVAYGALNTAPYTLKLRMNNPSTLQPGLPPSGSNGNSIATISNLRIITSKGPSHNTWVLAGTQGAGQAVLASGDYLLEETGVTGFSFFNGGGNDNNPLPVELVSFSGACDEGIINLTWQTASEFNSSHFDVEKSRDGDNWQLLTTLPSAGTSNELITYQSTDQNGTEGNNYFRLRQVDIDGTEKLYDPINVSCSEVTTGYFSSFPNPSGTSFQVVVNNKELIGACTLNMVDASGKVIEQRTIDVKEGINLFVINQELNPGIYFLNISNGSKSTPVLRHAIK